MLVANITDINDKIYDAARPAGRPSGELAAEMTDHYVADTDRLGLGRPDHEPQATLMVEEIVELIGDLIERDHAYVADGDVYFRVRSLPEYGALSHRDVDQMDQGEGARGLRRARRIRSTSRSGRRASRWRTPGGTRRGARAGPAGTSSARRWRRRRSARRSRSTAAATT